MSFSKYRRLALALAVMTVSILMLASCGGNESPINEGPIPLEIIFGLGDKINPTLSPDGKSIAYLGFADQLLNIYIRSLDDEDDFRQITFDSTQSIRKYSWSPDSKRIYYPMTDATGLVQLLDMILETGEIRNLTPMDNIRAQILDINNQVPDSILIAFNTSDPRAPHAYKLEVKSGSFTMAAENLGSVIGWVPDPSLNVRGCVSMNDNRSYSFKVADSATGKWVEIISWNQIDILSSSPIGFTSDGKYAHMLSSKDANSGRLQRIKLSDRSIETIAEDSIFDVKGVMFNPVTNDVEAVTFLAEREKTIFFDDAIETDIEAIEKIHHGDYFISNRDIDDKTWLIGFRTDNGPVPFYIYDRKSKKASFLFYQNPELEGYSFASMEPISFQSRDGLTIYGYITFPNNAKRTNLPMVVFVHEGPWQRDIWGFNQEAQWLANRGYICLQINYRGSTGYGKKFWNAGNKQWGAAMLDDLVDGAKWAIEKEYADPSKIGIMGWRYGGYTALMGAIRYPDIFSCALDVSGYLDLKAFIRAIPASMTNQRQMYFNRVGSPMYESELLQAVSPVNYIDSVNVPLLITHGSKDPFIAQPLIDNLVSSLENRGVPVRYLVFDNESHGLAQSSNRMLFYQTAEEFLSEHLKGKAQ